MRPRGEVALTRAWPGQPSCEAPWPGCKSRRGRSGSGRAPWPACRWGKSWPASQCAIFSGVRDRAWAASLRLAPRDRSAVRSSAPKTRFSAAGSGAGVSPGGALAPAAGTAARPGGAASPAGPGSFCPPASVKAMARAARRRSRPPAAGPGVRAPAGGPHGPDFVQPVPVRQQRLAAAPHIRGVELGLPRHGRCGQLQAEAHVSHDAQRGLQGAGGLAYRPDDRLFLRVARGHVDPDPLEAGQRVERQLGAGEPVLLQPGARPEALEQGRDARGDGVQWLGHVPLRRSERRIREKISLPTSS